MRTVTIKAKVTSRTLDTPEQVVCTKDFVDIDVMKVGTTVRSWCTREYNKALKAAPRDTIVSVEYHGQLAKPPYMSYYGSMSGLNGKTMRRAGEYDQL